LFFFLSILAAFAAKSLRPADKIARHKPPINLAILIPESFGGWNSTADGVVRVVNPVQEAMLERLYTETLSRSYTFGDGYRVMLSIAYGEDQRDAVQLHYPEVCYPAQGFRVLSNQKGVLRTAEGTIPVRRLETILGEQRSEPVTYWTMLGEDALVGGVEKKLLEIRYGFRGLIPDGLLFRVSSIDSDSGRAFEMQRRFVEDLIVALDRQGRARIAGLTGVR